MKDIYSRWPREKKGVSFARSHELPREGRRSRMEEDEIRVVDLSGNGVGMLVKEIP
jgi:hypothetical protein